jgi:hypothetical protein
MGFPSQSPFYHCNSFLVPSNEDSEGGWCIRLLFLTLTFVTTGRAHLSALRAGRNLPQEIPWYSLLLEAEWTPGLLNVDKRIRSLENFQGPNWESSPELQHSHSTIVPYSADQSSVRSTIIQIRQHIVASSVFMFMLADSSVSEKYVCHRKRQVKNTSFQSFNVAFLFVYKPTLRVTNRVHKSCQSNSISADTNAFSVSRYA